MINNYKKLEVWQKSVELVLDVYSVTKKFPTDEKFNLVSQINRCAVSIPSNIAEGKSRGTDPDFKRFLLIAFGSGAELETQLVISFKLGYIDEALYTRVTLQLTEVMKMLNAFIIKLNASR
jgi:four helix bundle protein